MAKTVVIKIGSNVLTQDDGSPDHNRMASLVDQMVFLREYGIQVVLVTSGAVAFGRKALTVNAKTDAVTKKQVWASIGQIELIRAYKNLFLEKGHQGRLHHRHASGDGFYRRLYHLLPVHQPGR
jgi:glutamate 5-kinase